VRKCHDGAVKRPLPLAIVVVALLVTAIVALARVGDGGGGDAAPSTTTSSTAFDDTTTPTTATTTTAGVTTSSAPPAGSTSSTTARAARTTTSRAPTTTAVEAACGSGRATVSFAAKDLTTDALSSTFTPQVTVDNQVSAPIEVEEVSIEVTYPGNEVRTVRFTTAGTVIGPGTSASFTSDKLTSAQRYQAAKFTRFTYYTEGQRAACRVTTP